MNALFSNLFIFEVANNHQGSLDHGLRIVREMGLIARRHGIHAGVKLQYRDLDTFIHPRYRDRTDVPHIPRFLGTRLSDRDLRSLVSAVRDEGMVTVCTPFDETSVKRAVDHGVQILKVASCSADDWPLLEAVASAARPVVLSTGGLTLPGIDRLVRFSVHRQLDYALLHCVALYPTPNHYLNMDFVSRMRRRYPGVAIGYSGHEDPADTDVVKIAVAKGASILERHVGIELLGSSLNRYSLSPEQVDAWVRAALVTREICGKAETREPDAEELSSLRSLKRGVYVARAVARGERLTRDDVVFAMPCDEGQTTSGEFSQYRAAFRASRDYAPLDPLRERREPDLITFTRDIIHEAQGMMQEARVALGDDVEVELSHHHGLADFRKTGAILFKVIDRDYCKKILVMLPGQEHPSHFHRIKEETFQLLWGDLDVVLPDRRVRMKPGDQLLVPPGLAHGFSSRGGAIMEEISTRSMRGDSYYLDESIRRLDPIERKTVLDEWH